MFRMPRRFDRIVDHRSDAGGLRNIGAQCERVGGDADMSGTANQYRSEKISNVLPVFGELLIFPKIRNSPHTPSRSPYQRPKLPSSLMYIYSGLLMQF
jgi:hypothetical protein